MIAIHHIYTVCVFVCVYVYRYSYIYIYIFKYSTVYIYCIKGDSEKYNLFFFFIIHKKIVYIDAISWCYGIYP